MPAVFLDEDLEWLRTQIPKEDSLGFKRTKVIPILNLIKHADMKSLPMTIGVFGSWGTGKTTMLAMLAEGINRDGVDGKYYPIVYFNAWKYAGFMEVVPALVYKILRAVNTDNDPSKWNLASRIMLSLGNRYVDQFGDWTEKRFGINISDLAQDVLQARKEWTAEQERKELLEEYYTQVDKAQDALKIVFQDVKNPTVVIVDELDRCDPGEAFEAIKKLRVFFSMRGIPIIFLISVNPDPIGAAIRHQYGLASDISDYEARRILEKFVDVYIDMGEPVPLGPLIGPLMKVSAKDVLAKSLHRLDRKFDKGRYHEHTVLNSDVFHAIQSDNRLYSNIRILKKSWDHVIWNGSDAGHLWSKWHLEILKQGHLAVRKKVKKVALDLASIAAASHLAMLGDLDGLKRIDWKACLILMPGELRTPKGNTAFAIYRSWFWDLTKDRIAWREKENTLESLDRAEVLKEFVTDHHLMEFFCIMSLIDFPLDGKVQDLCANRKGPFEFDLGTIEGVSHYSWALANF